MEEIKDLIVVLFDAWEQFKAGGYMDPVIGFVVGTAGIAIVEAVADAIVKRTNTKKDDQVWAKIKPFFGAVRWLARTVQTWKPGGYTTKPNGPKP